ncbi:MAG: hypothetical protein OEM62_02065 [Acidobacteriota bacterium]|nr:hypothetical protein [Acidobacteriota bacterium]
MNDAGHAAVHELEAVALADAAAATALYRHPVSAHVDDSPASGAMFGNHRARSVTQAPAPTLGPFLACSCHVEKDAVRFLDLAVSRGFSSGR